MASQPSFVPARLTPKESASDSCARAIRAAILNGELSPGERLPPERTLSQRFGTSRLTLRAGLSQLAAAGLLSVRQGSGYVVQDFHKSGGTDLLGGLAALARQRGRLAETAADLLRVRRHLAGAAFERLLETWRPASARRVAPRLAAFADAVAAHGRARAAGDAAALAAAQAAVASADLELVAAIIAEADSPVLGLCMNPIARVLGEMSELTAAMYAEPEGNLAGFRAILAGLDAHHRGLPALVVAELTKRDEATLKRLRSGNKGKRT